jgi:phosphoadenosine phosphosulfate reductase
LPKPSLERDGRHAVASNTQSLSDYEHYRALLAELSGSKVRERQSREILEPHLAEIPGYVAWSGGRDSTAALVLALSITPDVPVVWFHSGLEFPETEQYISEIAERLSANLHIIRSEPDALTLLKETGSWDHDQRLSVPSVDIHEALVTRPSERAHAQFGPGEVLGLRASEGRGRRLLLAQDNGRYARASGAQVACPIWRWTPDEVSGFLYRKGVPENPVYAKLARLGAPPLAQRVGLLVDGNGVTMGRLTWLRAGWPALFAELTTDLPRLREWR